VLPGSPECASSQPSKGAPWAFRPQGKAQAGYSGPASTRDTPCANEFARRASFMIWPGRREEWKYTTEGGHHD
jgi:hypothetical protein